MVRTEWWHWQRRFQLGVVSVECNGPSTEDQLAALTAEGRLGCTGNTGQAVTDNNDDDDDDDGMTKQQPLDLYYDKKKGNSWETTHVSCIHCISCSCISCNMHGPPAATWMPWTIHGITVTVSSCWLNTQTNKQKQIRIECEWMRRILRFCVNLFMVISAGWEGNKLN